MKHSMLHRALPLIMALLLALDLTVTFSMLQNSDTLDLTFGKGEERIVNLEKGTASQAQYYRTQYASQADARLAALQVSRRISDEGTVLLKNDGLLPLSPDTPVTPLGLGCFMPLYCGSGSSVISTLDTDVISPLEGLHQVFASVNESAETVQRTAFETGSSLMDNPNIETVRPLDQSGRFLYEFRESVFSDAVDTFKGTVGIVYITRRSGENEDACMSAYEDGTPHALALTGAEKKILALAKDHCSAVIAVISCASPMELACLSDDPDVSAILWQGGAGSTGYASVAGILAGSVNPSGRLPFTFAADFTRDPTYPNQDDGSDRFTYDNALTTGLTSTDTIANIRAPFHEYEEGIYLGYRYYETAYDIGALSDYYNRSNGVVYPFGFGLSYTNFSREITGISRKADQTILRVQITNQGKRAGKDTVQVYCTAPYTDLDKEYMIEKPTAFLVAFAKTIELAPGQSQTITFTIEPEDFGSYCYTHLNSDGTTGCYVTEGGSYILSLRSDSHTVLDSVLYNLPGTAWLGGSLSRPSERAAQSPMNQDGTVVTQSAESGLYRAATNQFDQLNTYMTEPGVSHAVPLSRSDWKNTQPTTPTDADRTASGMVVQWIREADAAQNTVQVLPPANAPVSGAKNGLTLADLRGVSYDNPMWDKLLDQLTYKNPETYRKTLFEAAYETGALSTLRKPRSSEKDGPQGLTQPDLTGKNWIDGVCGYPAAPVMAATWNEELLCELGAMVGQEALLKDINGWYAPGLNILRSPFCGRSSEYYSEDPLLAGLLGTQVVSGAGDNGLSCAAKHFCLMETEAHKGPNTCTWMTEQALREIYLRPFELVIKNAKKTVQYQADITENGMSRKVMRAGDFLMVSDSGVGPVWTALSSALLTEVVRGEWGFAGAVITDMHMNGSSAMISRMLSAGCDMLMSSKEDKFVNLSDYTSGANQTLIRRAVKNVCYTQVNSALMQDISSGSIVEYSMSPWKKALLIVNIAVGALLLICAAFLCWDRIRMYKSRKSS